MTYHINNDGNIGKCEARFSCPFGNFETQHYVTKNEARAAYEAAMRGTTFSKASKDIKKREEERGEDLDKHLAKLRKKAGPPPFIQSVPRGYFTNPSVLETLRPGDQFDGKTVLRAHLTRHRKPKEDGREATFEFVLGERPSTFGEKAYEQAARGKDVVKHSLRATLDGKIAEERFWINNEHDPEVVAQREAQAREYGLRAAQESVVGSIPRRPFRSDGLNISDAYWYRDANNERSFYEWSPRKILKPWARWHGERVEAARKSGVANPEQFAYAQLVKAQPQIGKGYGLAWRESEQGDELAVDVLRAVLDRDDSVEFNEHHRRIIRETWPEGERPFIDYKMEDLGISPKVVKD